MKRFLVWLITGLITFFVGVGIVTFRLSNAFVSTVKPQEFQRCIAEYDTNSSLMNDGSSAKAHLFSRFQELPLDKLPACVDESYRLTWIPTFHAPTVIRVWRSGGNYFITTKRLNGKGGCGMGDLEIEQTRSITVEEWENFETPLLHSSYWKMPTKIDEPIPNDGAVWWLEGSKGEKYHFVYRINPADELRPIITKLFNLTRVKTEYRLYLSSVDPN